MDVNTRNRVDLKSFFVKNSIPTEGNFADLIDGMLNQKDDGVVKTAGQPLSIAAAGDAAGTQPVLNFYRNFTDASASAEWTLSLNPRSNAADPNTARRGLSITDGDGNSRLFIDRGSGNVGIGTLTPGGRLHLAAPHPSLFLVGNTTTDENGLRLHYNEDIQTGVIDVKGVLLQFRGEPRPATGSAATARMAIDLTNGRVGIGTTAPSHVFHVHTADEAVGLFESTGTQAYLRFSSADGWDNRVEIANRPGGRLALWVGGAGDALNITRDGNVGIGTAGQSKLHVLGNAGVLNLEGQNHVYIQWYPSGVAAGRKAYLGYGTPGDSAFTIQNDAGRMHIAGSEYLYLLNTSGVIIGKEWGGNGNLTVEGDAYTSGSDIYFTGVAHNHTGVGNVEGHAAIENAQNFSALMLLGRQISGVRYIRTWDSLEVVGTFINHSDQRSKQDIEDLGYGLESVRRLRPVSFNWKTIPNPHKSLGLVAQDVREVIHEVVYAAPTQTDDPDLSISYISLIPVLINAIKQLDAEVQRLSAERGASAPA